MARVVHFELPADNPERLIKFYEDAFNWQVSKWDGPFDYWLVMTGTSDEPGIDGAIGRRGEIMGYVNTIDVSSLDNTIEKVTGSGGEIVAPKNSIPGVGTLAYCKDPEGNIFGLMQAE